MKVAYPKAPRMLQPKAQFLAKPKRHAPLKVLGAFALVSDYKGNKNIRLCFMTQ